MGWMALLDEEGNEIGVVGDEPWDIMGKAVRDIAQAYQKDWHRHPTREEIFSILETCWGGFTYGND